MAICFEITLFFDSPCIYVPTPPLTFCGHAETEDAHGGILGHGLLHLAAEHSATLYKYNLYKW